MTTTYGFDITNEEIIETGAFEKWMRANLTWEQVRQYLLPVSEIEDTTAPATLQFLQMRKEFGELIYGPDANEILATVQSIMPQKTRIEDKRLYFNTNYMEIAASIKTYLGNAHDTRLRTKVGTYATLLLVRLYADMFDFGMTLFFYHTMRINNIHVVGTSMIIYANDDIAYLSAFPAGESESKLLAQGSQLAQIQGGQFSKRFDGGNPAVNLNTAYGIRMALRQKTPGTRRIITVLRLQSVSSPTINDLVQREVLHDEAAEFLSDAVAAAVPIIVAGAPGSGKTTLLRAICRFIPRGEPTFVAENYRELRLDQLVGPEGDPYFFCLHDHVEQEANAEGVGAIPMQKILEKGLQEDVKRIIIGEVVDPETMRVLLQAANTGQSGLLATIHAESLDDTVARIQGLLLESTRFTATSANNLISRTLKLIVHAAHTKTPTGSKRFVTGIGWVVPHPGYDDAMPQVLAAWRRVDGKLDKCPDYNQVMQKLTDAKKRLSAGDLL